jgi:hypothetical protein
VADGRLHSLIGAGFTDINVAVVRLEKEIPDLAIFARGLVYGNPLIDRIRARGGVDPDRIVDAVMLALRQEFRSDAPPGHRIFGNKALAFKVQVSFAVLMSGSGYGKPNCVTLS